VAVQRLVRTRNAFQINDTRIVTDDTFPQDSYFQIQFWGWQKLNRQIHYTLLNHNSNNSKTLNLKHRIYVKLKYK